MKKTILVSAAGTATSWHIINTIRKHFRKYYRVLACDTNPPHLVAASRVADGFFTVPSVNTGAYYEYMCTLMRTEKVDIYVPLIDMDLLTFCRDNSDLISGHIFSTAPYRATAEICTNKGSLSSLLRDRGFDIPRLIPQEKVDIEKHYFVKPVCGFGSRGARIVSGHDVQRIQDIDNHIIQEVCSPPEITVEIFCYENQIHTVQRERIETKAGVCTKARFFSDVTLPAIIKRLVLIVQFPEASCVQFMKSQETGKWVITDVNLRLGAGTALSTAVGWDLVSAALSVWGNIEIDPLSFLHPPKHETYAVRVFDEIVMS